GWNFFNTGGNVLEGNLCPGGAPRESATAYVYNGSGVCSFAGWLDPGNPHDFPFFLNWAEGGWQQGDCFWAGTKNSCAHPICRSGASLNNTCDDCAAKICGVDPYCCTTAWDSICVGEVQSVCNQTGC